MSSRSARRYLLPFLLVTLSLLLLARVFLSNRVVLVPEDLELLLLVSLLGVALVAAIHTMMRIWMGYLRAMNVRQARRETLAEHSRFLSRLDHELKNPLTTLRTGLGTLALTGLSEPQQRIVASMETETLRLSRLVTDLRKLVELGTQPLNLHLVNMETFAEQIVALEQERYAAGKRALTYSTDLARPDWLVDEDLLALAVYNLLDNAFKYTQDGDSVHLSLVDRQALTIQVSDTGIGIEPDALPHVCEELYRANQVQTIPGSGIGLALVKAIVERHEGTLVIRSEPDVGTQAVIRLPFLLQ